MRPALEHNVFGVGFYSVAHAAKLAHVPQRSIRRWLAGYSYTYNDAQTVQPPVISAEIGTSEAGLLTVTFRDLLEIRFVHAFREHGVSWKTMRLAASKARDLFHTSHPFTNEAFFTDGRGIFAQLKAEGIREKRMLDIISDQFVFRSVMLPSFRAQIDFSRGDAERWWPNGRDKGIVLDPQRQFGQPIIADEGVPTAVLARAAEVMGSARKAAAWYAVTPTSVRRAVTYEQQLAA